MDKYREMQVFAAVVDGGSFAAAAEALGQSRTAVSRLVSELEQRLGQRLLHRTTRKLSVSDEGQTFYLSCKEILAAIDEAEGEISARAGEANGLLRMNVPLSFGILHLAPLWGDFIAQNPKVTLDLSLADRVVDLVEEGYDLAIRISRQGSSSLIRRLLATTRMVLCATPEYLASHPPIGELADLAQHEVIAYTYLSSGDEWVFAGAGEPVTIKTRARIHTNNGDTCRAIALKHQGVVYQPDFLVGEDLRHGRLVELLPSLGCAELGIYAVYASRKQQPLKLRRMIDFLVQAFERPAWR